MIPTWIHRTAPREPTSPLVDSRKETNRFHKIEQSHQRHERHLQKTQETGKRLLINPSAARTPNDFSPLRLPPGILSDDTESNQPFSTSSCTEEEDAEKTSIDIKADSTLARESAEKEIWEARGKLAISPDLPLEETKALGRRFQDAAKQGNVQLVLELIALPILAEDWSEALFYSLDEGDFDIAKELLQNHQRFSIREKGYVLWRLAEKGRTDSVSFLWDQAGSFRMKDIALAGMLAMANGHTDLAESLMHVLDTAPPSNASENLISHQEKKKWPSPIQYNATVAFIRDSVKKQIHKERIDWESLWGPLRFLPVENSREIGRLFKEAAKEGDLRWLRELARLGVSREDWGKAAFYALAYKHFTMAERLLDNEKMCPSPERGYALCRLAERGLLESLLVLLKHAIPCDLEYVELARLLASENGYEEIVSILTQGLPEQAPANTKKEETSTPSSSELAIPEKPQARSEPMPNTGKQEAFSISGCETQERSPALERYLAFRKSDAEIKIQADRQCRVWERSTEETKKTGMLFRKAAEQGSEWQALELARSQFAASDWSKAVFCAVKAGHLELAKRLMKNQDRFPIRERGYVLWRLAEQKLLDGISLMLQHGAPLLQDDLELAQTLALANGYKIEL